MNGNKCFICIALSVLPVYTMPAAATLCTDIPHCFYTSASHGQTYDSPRLRGVLSSLQTQRARLQPGGTFTLVRQSVKMSESPQMSGIQDLIRMIDEHLASYGAKDATRIFKRETYPKCAQGHYIEMYHPNPFFSNGHHRHAVHGHPDSDRPWSHFYAVDSKRSSSDSNVVNAGRHRHSSIPGLRVRDTDVHASPSQIRKKGDGVVNFITGLRTHSKVILKRVKRDHRSKMGRCMREQDHHLHEHSCHAGYHDPAPAPNPYPQHHFPRQPLGSVPQTLTISKPAAGGFKWY